MHDVIKRALIKAGLPSVLEPLGLDKEMDHALMVFLFSGGRSLVWNYMCVDAFTGIHLNRSAMEAGTAAKLRRGTQVKTLLLQRHISLSRLQSKQWECKVGPLESS